MIHHITAPPPNLPRTWRCHEGIAHPVQDAAPRKETAPVPSRDGAEIKGRGDHAAFRPIYFVRSPHGSRICSLPVMSAAGRLDTPRLEQSAHRAVRENVIKGQVAVQGVSFHSFVFPDFLQHLVLSLTEFVAEEDPGSMRPRGSLRAHVLRVALDLPPRHRPPGPFNPGLAPRTGHPSAPWTESGDHARARNAENRRER